MRRRLRVSLYARMAIAVGVLTSFSLLLTVFFVLVCLVGLAVTAPFVIPASVGAYEVATLAPRLSAAVGLPAALVAAVAAGYLYVSVRYAPVLAEFVGVEYVLWPTGLRSGLTTALTLGAIYEFVVEAVVAVGDVLVTDAAVGWSAAAVGAALAGVYVSARSVQHEVDRLRRASVDDVADRDSDDAIRERAGRLAALAGVPAPAVSLRETDRVYAYTVGAAGDYTIVLSTRLVDLLDPSELDAVLAHEISHVANRDVAVMALALAPVLVAEEIHRDDAGTVGEPDLGERLVDAVLDALTGALLWYGQRGAGVLSRGRERAADVAAAELTGEPAALATALTTLTDADEPPTTDLRDAEIAVQALNVTPRPHETRLAVATHPPTTDRVAVLRAMARERERA